MGVVRAGTRRSETVRGRGSPNDRNGVPALLAGCPGSAPPVAGGGGRVSGGASSWMEPRMTSARGSSAARSPTPVSTPKTRPAPAARPIARSAIESPTTAARAGRTPRTRHSWSTASGAGFTARLSSAQTSASTRWSMPSAARVRRVGSRSSLVATAIRRPAARSPASTARRSPKGRARRTGSGGCHAAATAASARCASPTWSATSATTTSRIRLIGVAARRPCGRTRAVSGSTPRTSNSGSVRSRPVTRPSSDARSPTQPPHIAWKSMRVPSLSKMTSWIPARGSARAAGFTPPR
jgi:hypothetical protein